MHTAPTYYSAEEESFLKNCQTFGQAKEHHAKDQVDICLIITSLKIVLFRMETRWDAKGTTCKGIIQLNRRLL
jgi:hypothetical protein